MSAAVLFYGFNLGAPDDMGWAFLRHGPGSEREFDWEANAEADGGNEYQPWMARAILLGTGVPEDDIPLDVPEGFLARRCGVQILTFGHSNTLFYGIALAGTVQWADDWSPKSVVPASTLDGHEPLARALDALGVKPRQANPAWILAPSEF
ncbi:hypothetical protein ACFW2V_12545 [Streptomyces sp. NPDC058947]|uniref:hypothetical protein n=1 Tax=Streptomyces sp. NPDC058947 TaxID=3346675 RepID=UPI0036B099C6